MFSTIFKLGPITITSLGILTFIGYFFGTFLIWKKEREENFDEEMIMDLILQATFFSIITARTLYILINWQDLGSNILSWFDFVAKPGFSFVGAFTGGIISSIIFARKRKLNFYRIADFTTFGIVIFTLFILMGQFLDGSSYGSITALPWGLKFPAAEGFRHPSQIYELIFMLITLKLLYYFDRNYRTFEWYRNKRGEAEPGFLFIFLLISFSLDKFIVAFFKERVLYWMEFQILYIIIILSGLLLIYKRTGKNPKGIISFLNAVNYTRKRPKQKFHVKSGMEAK